MFKRDVLMHQNQIHICNLPSIEIQSPPVEGTGAGTGTLHVVPAAPLKVS